MLLVGGRTLLFLSCRGRRGLVKSGLLVMIIDLQQGLRSNRKSRVTDIEGNSTGDDEQCFVSQCVSHYISLHHDGGAGFFDKFGPSGELSGASSICLASLDMANGSATEPAAVRHDCALLVRRKLWRRRGTQ